MAYYEGAKVYIRNGALYYKKRKRSEWMLLLVMLWPFVINLISSLPGALSYLQYLCDGILLCWVLVFFLQITKKPFKIRRNLKVFVFWIAAFAIYTLVVYVCNYQSAFYYLWGLRSNFRCYLLFLLVLFQVNENGADGWLRLLDKLFGINAILSILQFFLGGVRQDRLGGIFGTVLNTNGFTLIFLSIVVAKSLLMHYENEEKVWVCLMKCATALLIAAMAELKFFLILFVFLIVFTSILTKLSWKKIIVFVFCAIAVSISINLLLGWFSSSQQLDLAKWIGLAFRENYATTNDLNRLSAISTLSRKIVTNPLDRLFGLGLGNCESANFKLLTTPFHQKYSYMHYNYFSAPMIFLETGYVGLGFYLGFFLICLFKTLKKRKTGNRLYNRMGIIFSVIAFLLAFYNASLRYEGGWMLYIVLALPFISTKPDLRKGE